MHTSRETFELVAIDQREPIGFERALLRNGVPPTKPVDEDVPRPDVDNDAGVIGA